MEAQLRIRSFCSLKMPRNATGRLNWTSWGYIWQFLMWLNGSPTLISALFSHQKRSEMQGKGSIRLPEVILSNFGLGQMEAQFRIRPFFSPKVIRNAGKRINYTSQSHSGQFQTMSNGSPTSSSAIFFIRSGQESQITTPEIILGNFGHSQMEVQLWIRLFFSPEVTRNAAERLN